MTVLSPADRYQEIINRIRLVEDASVLDAIEMLLDQKGSEAQLMRLEDAQIDAILSELLHSSGLDETAALQKPVQYTGDDRV